MLTGLLSFADGVITASKTVEEIRLTSVRILLFYYILLPTSCTTQIGYELGGENQKDREKESRF